MNTRPMNVKSESLDPSFGKEGVLRLPFPGVDGTRPLLVQALPNGQSLLVFGAIDTAPIYITRLHESGAIDESFGQQGVVEISLGPTSHFFPVSIHLLQNKGWILVGRHADESVFVPEGLAVVRQNEDGTFDTAFGDRGKVIIAIEDLIEPAGEPVRFLFTEEHEQSDARLPGTLTLNVFSAVQPQDGRKEKTLISATIAFAVEDLKGLVLRLDDQGNLDRTFNRSGFLLVDLPNITMVLSYARGVVVQPDNKVVVCGYFRRVGQEWDEAYVIRYQEHGVVDTSFGGRGEGVVTLGDSDGEFVLTRMSLKADGTILAVGKRGGVLLNRSQGLVINLNASGSFNLVFNDGKPLLVDMHPFQLELRFCTFQADGKIVVVGVNGSGHVDETNRQWVGRYLPNGKLDEQFAEGQGWTEFQSQGGINSLMNVSYMPDNRIMTTCLLLKQEPPFDIGGFMVRFLG